MINRVVSTCVSVAVLSSVVAAPALAGPSARQAKSDPFARPVAKKSAPPKPTIQPTEIAPPGLTARLKTCEGKSSTFGASARTTPCPYLVAELKLTGIYAGDKPGAVMLAEPTKEAVFLQVGDKLYDGEVVAISEATIDANAQVTFKKVTLYRAKGGQRREERTVTLELAN